MNELPTNELDSLEEIQVLIFTLAGATLGLETSQIDEILTAGQAEERQLDFISIHELIHCTPKPLSYNSSKVILIKGSATPLGLVIEEPEAILSLAIDQIQPLPVLIASTNSSEALWGAVVIQEEIVLLVDLGKLLEEARLT